MVTRQRFYLVPLQNVGVDPQVTYCAKGILAIFRVANEAYRLEAEAILRLAGLLAVQEEANLALLAEVEVIAHDHDVVPSFLDLRFVLVELGRNRVACFFADYLHVASGRVKLNVGACPVNILNKDMLSLSVVNREREDHPEADAPLLHQDLRDLNAARNLEHISEIEERSPVPVEAATFRQPVRIAPLDDEVV